MLFTDVSEAQQMPVTTEFNPEENTVDFPVSDEKQKEYFPVYRDEVMLVLLTTGEKSVLATGSIIETNGENTVVVEEGACRAIGVKNGDTIDAWVIPGERKLDLNYDDGLGETAKDNDPTNGSWLLLKTTELALTERSEDRRVYINKSFREQVALPHGREVSVLCEVIDGGPESIIGSAEGSVSIPESGTRITVPENVVADAGIKDEEQMSAIWLSTADINQQQENTIRETGVDTSGTGVDDGVGELDFSVGERDEETDGVDDDSSSDGGEDGDSNDEEEHPKSDWNGGSAERFVEEDQPQEREKNDESESIPVDDSAGVEVEYTSSVSPVVLLDDDERVAENWTGHYMNSEGELLCGKTFESSIDDPGRDHYDEVCVDCAVAAPGKIKQRDLAEAIESIVGFTIGEEEPFVLSREDAANLLNVLQEAR